MDRLTWDCNNALSSQADVARAMATPASPKATEMSSAEVARCHLASIDFFRLKEITEIPSEVQKDIEPYP